MDDTTDRTPGWVPGGSFVLGGVKLAEGFVPPSASLNPPAWRHLDGTVCVAGHDPYTMLCVEGGGDVASPAVMAEVDRLRAERDTLALKVKELQHELDSIGPWQ